VLGNLRLEAVPVPTLAGLDVPEVELQLALLRGAALPRLIRALGHRKLTAGLARGVVHRLEDVLVQLLRLGRLEGEAQRHERVGKALAADTDRAVAHVRALGLLDGVVILVDDPVQVHRQDLDDLVEHLEVERAVLNEGGQSDRAEVAHGGLIWRRVLHDLRAQVRRLDGAEVLLIGLG
jgi:hypothetical protein